MHDWTLCTGLGGSGAPKREAVAERIQLGVRRPVPCQRLFSAGHGSQFFEVQVDVPTDAQARQLATCTIPKRQRRRP